jgi:hypothetical protein
MAADPAGKPNIIEIISYTNVVEVVAPETTVEIHETTEQVVTSSSPTIEVIQHSNTVEVLQPQNVVEVYDTIGLQGVQGPQGLPGRFITSPTPPIDIEPGDAWYNTTTGKTYVWYDSYWVEVGNNALGDLGPTGPTGPTGSAGISINVTISTEPPTPSDLGAEGDLWVVT